MELHERILHVKSQLQSQVPDDIGGQITYLETLCNISAEMIDILPEIKKIYNEKLAEVSETVLEKYKDSKNVTATAINNEIKGKLAEEQKYIDTVERIRSTISTHSDNLRTIISYRKGAY